MKTIKELVASLPKGMWRLEGANIRHKRARDRNGERCCPIIWAYQRLKKSKDFGNNHYLQAAEELGLHQLRAVAIVRAVDGLGLSYRPQTRRLRRQILEACGLQEKEGVA